MSGWRRIAWQVTKAIGMIKKVANHPNAKILIIIRNEVSVPPDQFEAGDLLPAEMPAWLRRAADTIEKDKKPTYAGVGLVERQKDDEQ